MQLSKEPVKMTWRGEEPEELEELEGAEECGH